MARFIADDAEDAPAVQKQKEVVTDGKTDEEEKNLRIASNKSIWTAACA